MNVGGIQKALSRHLFLLAGVFAFVFLGAPKARAQTTDPMILTCTGSTTCVQSLINNVLVSTGLPSFTLSQNGSLTTPGNLTAYFVVVVPTSASVSFSVNGTSNSSVTSVVMTSSSNSNLFNALGLTYPSGFLPTSLPTFSNFNTLGGQAIGSQTSYTAYVFDVGSCSSCISISDISILLSGAALPPGTTFYAYLTSGSTSVVSTSDYSQTVTVVPEPATLGLIGSGLLLLGLVIRRRELGKS